MNHPDHSSPLLRRLANTEQDAQARKELARLRTEYPGHWIGAETIVGRGVRYVARACQQDAHPHTVITPDLTELRTALEAGRVIGQETARS